MLGKDGKNNRWNVLFLGKLHKNESDDLQISLIDFE